MKFAKYLVFLVFALSSNLFFHFVYGLVTNITESVVGYATLGLGILLLAILDVAVFKSFKDILNKSHVLSLLFLIVTVFASQSMEELYILIYIISFVGVMAVSVLLFIVKLNVPKSSKG